MVRRHDQMRMLPVREIRTKMRGLGRVTVGGQRQGQRIAGGEMPDLGGVDPMPGRDLARLQEKVDAGDRASAAAIGRVAERLDIVAAFRMRAHVEAIDQPRWRHRHGVASRADLDFWPLGSTGMTPMHLNSALSATITWLTEGARGATAPEDVLHQLCSQLRAAGLAIDRSAVFVRTLHPAFMGRRFRWSPEHGAEVNEADYDVLERDTFKNSPVSAVQRNGQAIRLHLESPDCPRDYNIVDPLRAEGFTDYVIHPLDFLSGQHHAISWATRQRGGFSDEAIHALVAVREPLARIAEILALRRTAANLLDTYVGRRTGQRILEGQIRRGDIETIHAAILMADLRGFTTISNSRPAAEVISILNAYYDCLVPPIEAHGGEILKFIGDGLLAIFPVEQDPPSVCDAALAAAGEGLEQLRQYEDGAYRCGMALHLGDVLYGNIGSLHRLDFTAIGPAVNLTARLEPLTRDLKRPIVTSAAFAGASNVSLEGLGAFPLRGFDAETEVFAPTEDREA